MEYAILAFAVVEFVYIVRLLVTRHEVTVDRDWHKKALELEKRKESVANEYWVDYSRALLDELTALKLKQSKVRKLPIRRYEK